MFHWVTGVPFQTEEHAGAYDDMTLWEQIDGGAQYTPAKKWLLVTPIALSVSSIFMRSFFLLFTSDFLSLPTTLIMSLGPSPSVSQPSLSTSSRNFLRYALVTWIFQWQYVPNVSRCSLASQITSAYLST